MSVIPRRITRPPEDCQVVWSMREPDRLLPDGSVVPGTVFECKQDAGTGWLWLGRIWRWRAWGSR